PRARPLWRPWLPRHEEVSARQMDTARPHGGTGDSSMGDKALTVFQHPVKLLWPKSQSFDYLYSVGEKLLQNFPVQATLSLYDDSDSEEEEDEEEEMEEEDDDTEDEEEDAAVLSAEAGTPQQA
ncbi:RIPP2 protein, partial [Crypturellus undulatus]|nr:RIPP2 protein [Crypturellus undulatus]